MSRPDDIPQDVWDAVEQQAVPNHTGTIQESRARAVLADREGRAQEWPKQEDGVSELVDSWRKFISARPQLMSFLYDIDLMPEQVVSQRAAHYLDAICCVYTAAEQGQIPLVNPEPSTP